MGCEKRHVFFVDDEPSIRKQVRRTLEPLDVAVHCFAEAEECLEQIGDGRCDLLITDVKMSGMDGLELLSKVRCIVPSLPVLVITGYGDVPMAVRAFNTGAFDFMEKPLQRANLISKVESAFRRRPGPHVPLGKLLTHTEKQILKHIIEGKSNREIAEIRHRSIRTVEDHRTRIFRKLGVTNVVELIHKINDYRPFLFPDES